MMKKSIIGFLLVSLFIFNAEAIGREYEYDAAFEPTKYNIVDQMLTIANVNENDLVYDLGCGDGRIVIAAAKKFGAKGIGIDIDPVRISESNENAIKEGVTDKVRFIEQNLFEANISDATVITLYLLPWVNLKLRPKLFHELKPGTRIVSHDHYMGEWLPDKTSEIDADGRNHTVYFWILPANVYGTWELTVPANTEKRNYILHLDQKFQEINGNLTAEGLNIPITDITINGDRLQFTIEEEIGNQKVTQMFEGLVNGNLIEGTVVTEAKTFLNKSDWKAKRDPSTMIPLDNAEIESY